MLEAQRQFGRQAHRYARSPIHKRGPIRWAWDSPAFLAVRET